MNLRQNITALRRDIKHHIPARQHILERHIDEPEDTAIQKYEREHGAIKPGEQVVILIRFGGSYGTTS